jgi:phosphatidylinositol alpha-1,6-mannosyltransferase
MERLMQNMAAGISQFAQLTVIGPKGCADHLPAKVRVREVPSAVAPFLVLSSALALRECYRGRFDMVVGGSGLIAPTLRILARLFTFRSIIYLHGLDLVVNNPVYQRVFVPAMRTLDTVIVNSRNTRQIAVDKGIEAARTVIIHPGTDLPLMPADGALAQLRASHAIDYQKIILFVGRMTQRKGLSRFIRNSLQAILDAEPAAGLVIVGKNPQDSLNQLGE